MTEKELGEILSKHKAGIVVLVDKDDDDMACGFSGSVHGIMALLGIALVEIQKESGESYENLGKMLNESVGEAIEKEIEELKEDEDDAESGR